MTGIESDNATHPCRFTSPVNLRAAGTGRSQRPGASFAACVRAQLRSTVPVLPKSLGRPSPVPLSSSCSPSRPPAPVPARFPVAVLSPAWRPGQGEGLGGDSHIKVC